MDTALVGRRTWLAGAALALAGCRASPSLQGGFKGAGFERGHLLRQPSPSNPPAVTHQVDVLIVGAGVAGLSAARALRMAGVENFTVLDLEDQAGGNARGSQIAGIAHPLGAHYLPAPSNAAPEVQHLLEELGVRQRVAGRWRYDEKVLCHSLQERLFFQGHWQEGLLPMAGVGAATLAQYQRFAVLVEHWRKSGAFSVPVRWDGATQRAWAALSMPFAAYLAREGLADAHLLWYLDYCCRDEFGETPARVSAWAGMHYFASRHGFMSPEARESDHEQVLTWPQGNGWLTEQLAKPLGERLHTAMLVTRVREDRAGVLVDAMNLRTRQPQRWLAKRCVMALPVFLAARVLEQPPEFLLPLHKNQSSSSWLVTNIHIDAPLQDLGARITGAELAWDNVIYGSPSLGYVNARHQSASVMPGETVLTHYKALGAGLPAREQLLGASWEQLAQQTLSELAAVHPDIGERARQIDITRYGHAMAVPTPEGMGAVMRLHQQLAGRASKAHPQYPARPVARTRRIAFAHSDWSGHSVFEEAFTRGLHAAHALMTI